MMKSLFSSLVLLAGLASAQSFEPFDPFQAPAPPAPPAPPSTRVYEYQYRSGGTYLGVSLAEVDGDRARALKLKEAYGVEITRVEEGSPAEKAGLKPGDVALEYNGQRVEGMEQFGRLVRETPPGREVKLLISRNGVDQTILATLAGRRLHGAANVVVPEINIPEIHIPDMPQFFTTLRSAMLGVEAESLGSQLATYFGVKEGVLVRSVVKESAAEKAGIKAGDVITKVDGSMVTTPNEVSSAVRSARSKKSFTVDVVREHKEMTVSVMIDDGRSERTFPGGRVVRDDVRL
jgi:serine protease Do